MDPKSLTYGLCRAVMSGHEPLVRLLLTHGADPNLKSGLALEIAINRKDLKMIKLLVEMPIQRDGSSAASQTGGIIIHPATLNLAMKCGHRDIIDYLVRKSGAMPSLDSIMAL